VISGHWHCYLSQCTLWGRVAPNTVKLSAN